MTEQGNLPTQRVNISTQKMLGGIGSILIAIGWVLGWVPGMGVLLIVGLAGLVLWLISLYQLSNMFKKSDIFRKALIGFILQIVGLVMAGVFGGAVGGILGPEILGAALSSPGGYGIETKLVFELVSAIVLIIGFIVAYPFNVIASYFYKRAYEILALATAQNLFKTAGLLIFIGAITAILFGLGLLLMFVGYIVLAVAFFTTPNEVEVQGA
jgi:uncharacterized membrane protein